MDYIKLKNRKFILGRWREAGEIIPVTDSIQKDDEEIIHVGKDRIKKEKSRKNRIKKGYAAKKAAKKTTNKKTK